MTRGAKASDIERKRMNLALTIIANNLFFPAVEGTGFSANRVKR
jgi:hypothetical protein